MKNIALMNSLRWGIPLLAIIGIYLRWWPHTAVGWLFAVAAWIMSTNPENYRG